MRRKQFAGFLVGFAGILAVGCQGQPPVEVSGKVRFRGKPVIWGTVNAIASDQMTHYATIQPDGSFHFEKLPPGPASFGIVSPDPYFQRSMTAEMKAELAEREAKLGIVPVAKPPKGAWFPIPARYADPRTANFQANLEGPSMELAWDLK